MSNLQRFYTRFIDLLHQLTPHDNFRQQIRIPKLSDKQLIALSLAAEAASIDSELNLFRQLPTQVDGLIERTVYNKRRRQLAHITEQFRQQIAERVIPNETYHLIDSMPLEVCKYSRSRRSRICTESTVSSPDYGYCAAQNMHYYGYKIHAVCTQQGVFKCFNLSQASLHDIHYLEEVSDHINHCVLIGDKGYLSQQHQYQLFKDNGVKLETPKRRNQHSSKSFPWVYRKARKRIETLFSQLCDQFMIRRNYAKSFSGFSTRVLAKITALTMIQWSNQLSGNKLNNLKIAIS